MKFGCVGRPLTRCAPDVLVLLPDPVPGALVPWVGGLSGCRLVGCRQQLLVCLDLFLLLMRHWLVLRRVTQLVLLAQLLLPLPGIFLWVKALQSSPGWT